MKKTFLLFILILLLGGMTQEGWGQVTLATFNFENNLDPESGAIGSPSLTASATVSYFGGSDGNAASFASANGKYFELTINTTGYTSISASWKGRTSSTTSSWVLTGDDGGGYGGTLISHNLTTSFTASSYSFGSSFNNKTTIKMRWTASVSASQTVRIDELIITGISATIPSITVTPTSLTNFSYIEGSGPSSEQSFIVSGANLNEDITLTAPANYEISETSGSDFTNEIVLGETDGSVGETTIYVRLKAVLDAGNYNDEAITASSTDADDKTVICSGTVINLSPTTQASNIYFTEVSEAGFTINWTNGDGTNRIVLVKSGSAVNSDPVDGTSYTANTAFGSGSQIGTGNYVVYNSTSNTVSVTGLNASTTYHVAIYEFNGSSSTENYLTSSPAIASRTTASPAVGWQITATDQVFIIDFDQTVQGVNNGQFNGSGFAPSPSSGRLNSNTWAVTGWDDGNLAFGGTRTSSSDYTRGNSNGGVTQGGIYAFLVGTENRALGFQPGSSDWAPGTLTLKLQNQTTTEINSLLIKYIVYIRNDQGRSSSFNFSHSEDDNTYTEVPNLDLTSPEAADGSPSWKSYIRSINITGLNIPHEGYYYLRWSGADVGGSGSRDEFALDDISLAANPSSVNPSISGTIEEIVLSGNNSLSGNLTIQGNLTLNNGTITTGNHVITANNITGGSATSYIKTTGTGGLKRNVPHTESGTLFPVGTETSYNPVTISNSGTADNFTVSVKEDFDVANPPVDESKVVLRQWTISEETTGGSNATVTLQWNADEHAGSFNVGNTVYIGRFNGSAWVQTEAVVTGSNPYVATASGFTSFSPFGVGNEGALPVELESFAVNANNDVVKLSWQTATEVNNYGFEIERSAVSGQTSAWEKIGFVKGNGNSNSTKNYSFTDNAVSKSGKYAYRLKQVDNDGSFTYSQIVETDVTVNLSYSLGQNYPNPFNPTTKISYTIPETGLVTLKVYNIVGESVAELVNKTQEAGKYEIEFNGSSLSNGVYFYELKANGFTSVKKLMLLK